MQIFVCNECESKLRATPEDASRTALEKRLEALLAV